MAIKYTIWKVLIRNFSRGFTLIELIVGLLIMSIVGGLAMNAFIAASKDFNEDKKDIESSQNLSAILEIIGNDIKQAGEQINRNSFPTIEISSNTVSGSIITESSTVVIRRALTQALTLCATIPANTTPTELIVADNTQTATSPNCNPLPLQLDTSLPKLSSSLRDVRNYRCKLDNINGVYTSTTSDFCQTPKSSPDLEKVRAAVFDSADNFRVFNYTDDAVVTADTKFKIVIDSLASQATASAIGSPIYLIEERVYKLDNDGILKMSIDGGSFQPLIKGVTKFKVSARLYSDTTTKAINTAPANACADNANYACTFNASTANYNWRNLAGVKVELRSRYDSTGRGATPSTDDINKLTAAAEFFPRNVLSK
ncbi:prepilin-type N-terminal cleavage/methylation domain-containing protein [Chamaesiphon sp. OTE_20_metabat_361]|uniref:PilW family protein n=1 Tax=Chamaesiphon sp. OTE_20_metabat_361 TaxID=2964689 RepID=UPI00286C832A|nr:prepilin-type N-terminal cleavage/methylation domain-containing protein [Chamaesiphon sp. OTE_20_metabat_361]